MRIVPPSLQPLVVMSAVLRRIDAFTSRANTFSQRRTAAFVARHLLAANHYTRQQHPPTTPTRHALHGKCNSAPSNSTNKSTYALTLCIPTPEDMLDMGGLLSVNTKQGDILLLDGDLGAGKTCFSRGFIRARTGVLEERVTSPTYLLSNCYLADGGDTKIYHLDLYRLSGYGEDLLPLDLDNVFHNCISLIEWPSRLTDKPDNRLDVTLTIEPGAEIDDFESKSRIMKLESYGGEWMERLKFLETEGYFDDLLVESCSQGL